MISEKALRLFDQTRHLLPPSGAYAMGELIAEVRRLQGILPPTIALREALADLCHQQWSGWMRFLFSQCIPEMGNIVIPDWAIQRWQRQMKTDYADLTPEEQDADRKEADKFLALLGKEQSQNATEKAHTSFIVTLEVPGVGREDLRRRLTTELQEWVHGARRRLPEFLEASVLVTDPDSTVSE